MVPTQVMFTDERLIALEKGGEEGIYGCFGALFQLSPFNPAFATAEQLDRFIAWTDNRLGTWDPLTPSWTEGG